MTAAATAQRSSAQAPVPRRQGRGGLPLTRVSGVGLGVAMLWFSLLVLIPLAAVIVTASEGGWDAFWRAVTTEQTAASIRLTVVTALLVTLVNVVMGTIIAWVLVRDCFVGQRAIEILIDVPFALPTIVAGLVLLSLYGPSSPLGIDIANSRPAVFLAFLFVTLPFVVRTVQPVLAELDREVEEAAASLGAGRFTIFRRIILPSLTPAIAAGAALSFARGGQRVRLAGPALGQPADADRGDLGADPVEHRERQPGRRGGGRDRLLVISFVVIVAVDLLQRRVVRRG